MTNTALKAHFFEQLSGIYPDEEVGSFFNLLAESWLGLSRIDLALRPDETISEEKVLQFESAMERLKKYEPIQHIIGKTEFYGFQFQVDKNVLIPRPETEELVAWILEEAGQAPNILDIGTGSGCIAISLAKKLPKAKVTALDISLKALEIAKANAKINKVEIAFKQADILKIPGFEQQFDIIVSNPPYVRALEKRQMHPNVLKFEPDTALYVEDENPLIFYKKITNLAENSLKSDGKLYFEINQYLGPETQKLVESHQFKTELKKDIFGNFRMLKGIKR